MTRTTYSTYSTYEAKAKFSEILRKVRAGESVLVTYRGRDVAEIRPITKVESTEERFERLVDRGAIVAASTRRGPLDPIAVKPGALERFLESRD